MHFDGHGTYLPRTGVGALTFEREDGTTHLVRGRFPIETSAVAGKAVVYSMAAICELWNWSKAVSQPDRSHPAGGASFTLVRDGSRVPALYPGSSPPGSSGGSTVIYGNE